MVKEGPGKYGLLNAPIRGHGAPLTPPHNTKGKPRDALSFVAPVCGVLRPFAALLCADCVAAVRSDYGEIVISSDLLSGAEIITRREIAHLSPKNHLSPQNRLISREIVWINTFSKFVYWCIVSY